MNWQLLFSTFGLVFVAELGDKTQLAIVTQTCKYRRPLPVFAGGSLALIGVTALGALGGQIIGRFVPPETLRFVAAAAFVVMGLLILRESLQNEPDPAEEACDCPEEAAPGKSQGGWCWPAFSSTLGLLFFAELGDKTQLAVLSLSGNQATPWEIFAGGALALTAVTALGVLCGQSLCKWIPERLLLRISAAAFVIMGLMMAVGIL